MRGRRKSGIAALHAVESGERRPCDQARCPAVGLYPAPRARDALDSYYWFCLDHVRAYNRAWNYYAGMTEAEVEAMTRADTVWQRPSWPLGERVANRFREADTLRADPFVFFEPNGKEARAAPAAEEETEQTKALRLFELTAPTTLERIKERYKSLVKRHHPDMHGGDRAGEDRLKEINLAYRTLLNAYCA